MTSIDPPRDGAAARMRRANTAPVDKPRRGAPVPAPRAPGAENTGAAALAGRRTVQERGPERRTRERRVRRTTVLLDTRSAVGNRRRGARRGADRSTAVRRRERESDTQAMGTLLDDDVRA